MPTPCIPSLTDLGWVTEPSKKFDLAIADFLASNYSQSEVYYGKIASLPYVIQNAAGDLMVLKRLASETLHRHLSGLFETVSVNCETQEVLIGESTRTMLVFKVTIIDEGKGLSFDRVIEDINSPSLKMITLNNG
jgi:hypothetical protein